MCENCKNLFDLKENLPFLIPCGHTLCQKCLDSLEFNNKKMKCPLDSNIYEIDKEKIPKNEILIEYIQTNKVGPKYSYQIREYVIEEATFCHIDKRNCFQKLCHYIYVLVYIKMFLGIVNIIFYPFKKVYHIIKRIFELMNILRLKIKEIILKIFKKIKSIKFPKINCKYCSKIKNKIIHSKIIRGIIKFCKYTIRAPIWINYLKLMKNLIYESQAISKNKCIKVINVIMSLIGIFIAHLIAYLTNNLENFFIILLLLNESVIILNDFRKMDIEKANKKYINKNTILTNVIRHGKKRSSDFGMGKYKITNLDEEDEEYLIDKKKHHRGKKCLIRWTCFLLFWYFFPMVKKLIYNFIEYTEYSKNIDVDLQEKNIKIWIGVVNSLLLIPKLLIVIYLTS